jgi:arylformamidase
MAPARRVHDLTALLETHMPVWPGTPLPVFEPVGFVAKDGYLIERVSCLTHCGTHLDAPAHFLEDGVTVDRIPPERLVGSAAVLDLRKELNGPIVTAEMVAAHWPKGTAPEIVLLETGWSRKRALTKQYLYDFPGLDPAAAEWLVQKSVHGVGTDTLGIDPYANQKFEAHKVLLRQGIWLLEALDHLDELAEGTLYTLVAAPIKLAGGSGGMARVFALEG